MIKKIKILVILLSFCFSLSLPEYYVNANGSGKEIDISTSPHKIFFEIQNGRPGDTYIKRLTIKNKGTDDFKYLFSNRFLTGSEKFYNELELKVADKDGELFNGKLKDFEKLDSRKLNSHSSEEITMSVTIPYELGNMYQGLNSEFQFKFFVEGTLGGTIPVDGPKLPETGTKMFNFMVAGAILLISGLFFQLYLLIRKKISSRV